MSTSEINLWPSDITSQDFLTPKEILQSQADILSEQMNEKVRGEIEEEMIELEKDPRQSRVVLRFNVVAANGSLRVRILDVTHRKEFSYPAVIRSHENLPNYLRDRYYKQGIDDSLTTAAISLNISGGLNDGRWIENDGVCSTPKEFLEKLKITLGTPEVKSAVMSVLAAASK